MTHPKLFRLLWAGQSLSNLADALYLLSVITMVYKLTGSALFSAFVALCRVAGQLTCGIMAPLIMDRFRLTSLIKLSQLMQVALFAVLALVAANMSVSGIPIALLLIALLSFTDGITTPVRNSLIPMYAGKNELMKANGLMSTTDQTVMLLGWAVGGILVTWLGGGTVMGLTLAMYAGALVLTLQLKEPAASSTASLGQKKPDPAGEAGLEAAAGLPELGDSGVRSGGQKIGAWASVKEGWQNIWRNKTLRLLIVMDTIEGTVGAAWIGALMLVYATEQLGRGTEWYGIINGGYFAGCIIGGLLIVAFTKRLMRRPALSIMAGAGLMGLMTLGYAATETPWVALLLVILMGPPQQLREVTRRTVFQSACPPEQLPKVMSAENTLVYSLLGLSVVLLSWMADRWGISAVYAMTGSFYLLTAGLAGLNRSRLQGQAVVRDEASDTGQT